VPSHLCLHFVLPPPFHRNAPRDAGVLTKIYNIYPFIYQNIQHIGVFTKISTVNGDPVADNTSPATGTPAMP
jgi:hypothetical protein